MPIDLSTSSGLTLSLLPEIILTTWGCIVLLIAAWRHESPTVMKTAGRTTLVGLFITLIMVGWMWVRGWESDGLVSMMALDPFRYATAAVFILSGILAVALSIGYVERENIKLPEYYAMVIFAIVGMMFMAGGTDLIVIFVGLELMSVAVYVLAGVNRRSIFSAEAALKYFLLGAFASAFFLYGIALLYGTTGSTNLTLIDFQIAAAGASGSLMLLAGVGLLLIGFAFKVAAVPFHMWAPDVYDGSPTPIAAFMATAVKAAGFAALFRILIQALGGSLIVWQDGIWWLAVITMIVGNMLALAQRRLKRMLAYSSIGHAGYILVAVASGTQLGVAAFLFYILAYTLMTVGAFTVLAVVGRDGEQDVRIDSFAGLADKRPWLALAMMVFMLSLLGFPGTAGFIGKWYIITSAVEARQALLAVMLVVGSVISAGYYLPVVMAMYMKPAESDEAHSQVDLFGGVRLIIGATAVILLLFGVWPNRALDVARDGARDLRPDTPLVETARSE